MFLCDLKMANFCQKYNNNHYYTILIYISTFRHIFVTSLPHNEILKFLIIIIKKLKITIP